MKNKQFWLKSVSSDKNEFCSIKCFKSNGNSFYPKKTKSKLGVNDAVVGNYWFDGCCWCFSLFFNYQYLQEV